MEENAFQIKSKMPNLVEISSPYILFIPTYAANDGRGAIPKSIVKFLNNQNNRTLLKGIVASGNKNFGSNFCLAGDLISNKCDVPVLYRYELRGTQHDVTNVMDIFNA
jgi:protein involved in ribonucleotide reduction